MFTRKTAGWHQSAELSGSDNIPKEDDLGDSVAVSGDSVFVGTFAQGSSPGLTYLFTTTATGWRQTAGLASGASTTGGQRVRLFSGDFRRHDRGRRQGARLRRRPSVPVRGVAATASPTSGGNSYTKRWTNDSAMVATSRHRPSMAVI
jgi:hypothetical protein